jgi:hypothetical protein
MAAQAGYGLWVEQQHQDRCQLLSSQLSGFGLSALEQQQAGAGWPKQGGSPLSAAGLLAYSGQGLQRAVV